jgi:uncharacterized repeat protein (TIGR03833 family)
VPTGKGLNIEDFLQLFSSCHITLLAILAGFYFLNSLHQQSFSLIRSESSGRAKQRNNKMSSGIKRSDIQAGLKVSIVLKQDQRSGQLTEGIVKEILTKSPTHPHGIKVRLENGLVGRVKAIN